MTGNSLIEKILEIHAKHNSVPGFLTELRKEFGKGIFTEWTTDDVLSLREDLTEEEALEVLHAVARKFDAEFGINWHVIESTADFMFPRKEKNNHKS